MIIISDLCPKLLTQDSNNPWNFLNDRRVMPWADQAAGAPVQLQERDWSLEGLIMQLENPNFEPIHSPSNGGETKPWIQSCSKWVYLSCLWNEALIETLDNEAWCRFLVCEPMDVQGRYSPKFHKNRYGRSAPPSLKPCPMYISIGLPDWHPL